MKKSLKQFLTFLAVVVLGVSLTACTTTTQKVDPTTKSADPTTQSSETTKSTTAHQHELSHHDAVAGTDCEHKGTVEYWSCECGKMFSDAQGKTEIESIEGTFGAHTLGHHDAVAPTDCQHKGTVEYWDCSVCSKKFSDAQGATEISTIEGAYGAHTLGHHDATAGTCQVKGTVEYWDCSVCSKKFSDAQGATEISTIEGAYGAHNLSHHDAEASTCTVAGKVEYWSCSVCEKNFAEEAATTELSSVAAELAQHNYQDTVFYDHLLDGYVESGKKCSVCGDAKDKQAIYMEVYDAVKHITAFNSSNQSYYTPDLATKTITVNTMGASASQWCRFDFTKNAQVSYQYAYLIVQGSQNMCVGAKLDTSSPANNKYDGTSGNKQYKGCSEAVAVFVWDLSKLQMDSKLLEKVVFWPYAVKDSGATSGSFTVLGAGLFNLTQGTQKVEDHNFKEWVKSPEGHKAKCSCGAEGEIVGHSMVDDAAVPATCTEGGKEAGQHCSVCGYATGGAATQAKGHTYVKQEQVEPTCEKAGHIEYWACECGAAWKDEAHQNAIADLAAWLAGDGKIELDAKEAGDLIHQSPEFIPGSQNAWDAEEATVSRCTAKYSPVAGNESLLIELAPRKVGGEWTKEGHAANNGATWSNIYFDLPQGANVFEYKYFEFDMFVDNAQKWVQFMIVGTDGRSKGYDLNIGAANSTAISLDGWVHVCIDIADVYNFAKLLDESLELSADEEQNYNAISTAKQFRVCVSTNNSDVEKASKIYLDNFAFTTASTKVDLSTVVAAVAQQIKAQHLDAVLYGKNNGGEGHPTFPLVSSASLSEAGSYIRFNFKVELTAEEQIFKFCFHADKWDRITRNYEIKYSTSGFTFDDANIFAVKDTVVDGWYTLYIPSSLLTANGCTKLADCEGLVAIDNWQATSAMVYISPCSFEAVSAANAQAIISANRLDAVTFAKDAHNEINSISVADIQAGGYMEIAFTLEKGGKFQFQLMDNWDGVTPNIWVTLSAEGVIDVKPNLNLVVVEDTVEGWYILRISKEALSSGVSSTKNITHIYGWYAQEGITKYSPSSIRYVADSN